MSSAKKTWIPLLTHWSYIFLALNDQYSPSSVSSTAHNWPARKKRAPFHMWGKHLKLVPIPSTFCLFTWQPSFHLIPQRCPEYTLAPACFIHEDGDGKRGIWPHVNSLPLGRCGCYLKLVILKLISRMDICRISYDFFSGECHMVLMCQHCFR